MDPSIYRYDLPEELMALRPAVPRDSSRLLVYNTTSDEVNIAVFRDIARFLPPKSTLVLNNTRVIPARVTLFKKTGGRVVCLFLVNELDEDGEISCLMDRRVIPGAELSSIEGEIRLRVTDQKGKIFKVSVEGGKNKLITYLSSNGNMPIPPYLRLSTLSPFDLKRKYQTIFSQNPGSVAAPTASLHFTNRVFNSIDQKSINKLYVTLQVGMGTFAPLTNDHIQKNALHKEWYQVPKSTASGIMEARLTGNPVIAVGTTVVRSLESYALKSRDSQHYFPTSLFIHKPYRFKLVDGLVTNFHLPESSLMMLVDAFLDYKKASKGILDLYRIAIAAKLRFYSFGDAMLIL